MNYGKGCEITSRSLVVRTSATAAKAARRPWRGPLEARVPARAEVTHVRSTTYAFKGMRPLFNRRATESAWHTRAAWSAVRIGTADVGPVQATGRAAHIRTGAKTTGADTFFRSTAGATARLRAIAKFATTLKRRRLVSAEIATYLGRRARATKLLTQRRIPIENTTAMDWIVLPNSRPVHVHRVEVEVVHVDNGDVAMRPVEGAEKEPYTHRNSDAPGETHSESGAHEIAGPRRPIDRRVRRPPPRPVDHRRIVVGDVDYFWPRRLDHDGLPLLIHADLVGRLEITGLIRLLTQILDCVHHLCLLGEKRIAEPFRPVQLLVHHLEDLGKRDERFDAGVPAILCNRLHRLVAFKAGIGPGPTRGLDDLERIGRGHQNLRQERVRVQRYRRQHLIEFLLRKRTPTGSHFGQCRRRGTRHNGDVGRCLVLLARTGVRQLVGEDV